MLGGLLHEIARALGPARDVREAVVAAVQTQRIEHDERRRLDPTTVIL